MSKSFSDLVQKYQINLEIPSEIPQGWFDLVETMIQDLIEAGWNRELGQIKSKFAALRVYVNFLDKNPDPDSIIKIIALAESDSYNICEVCGKSPSNRGKVTEKNPWIINLCDVHRQKIDNAKTYQERNKILNEESE